MQKSNIYIGTSGFSYKDWLGNFYPQFCPQADFLRFYASKFKVVEIDSTYYRIPNLETVKKWCKSTPENFLFSAKFPNTVTHEGSVDTRLDSAKQFIKIMKKLGCKLGPLLLQFPYSFKPDKAECLKKILHALPEDIKFAIELRNKCWLNIDSLFDLLKEKNIAFCLIDHPWMPRVDITTADFVYFRFLGDRKKIDNDFSYIRFERDDELSYWKDKMITYVDKSIDCFAFFNNHYSGHAPTTAEKLHNLLGI